MNTVNNEFANDYVIYHMVGKWCIKYINGDVYEYINDEWIKSN